jgi:hypothetical protein
MYSALWRVLPGALWLKVLILSAAGAAIISLLMFVVFPYVDTAMTIREVTVE